MSTQPGKPYTIMNKQSGLVLYLSEEDQISIIGENDGPEDRKTWFVEPVNEGGAYIKSKANDSEQPVYIGFRGIPMEGVKLIAGPREDAGIWDIQPDVPPSNKIRLQGSPFMLEFPKNNLDPGTHAQLGLPFLDGSTNQTWVVMINLG